VLLFLILAGTGSSHLSLLGICQSAVLCFALSRFTPQLCASLPSTSSCSTAAPAFPMGRRARHVTISQLRERMATGEVGVEREP